MWSNNKYSLPGKYIHLVQRGKAALVNTLLLQGKLAKMFRFGVPASIV